MYAKYVVRLPTSVEMSVMRNCSNATIFGSFLRASAPEATASGASPVVQG